MEREDLRYWSEQHDIDARFTDMVSGGGALSSAPAPSVVAAAPRTSTTYSCDNCGRIQVMYEPVRYAPWCNNKQYGCNGRVMKPKESQ